MNTNLPLMSTERFINKLSLYQKQISVSSKPPFVAFDASFHLPNTDTDAEANFNQGHFLTARRFDINKIADTNNPLPHMAPTPEVFAQHMQNLGIRNDTPLVFYEKMSQMGAARGWWLCRLFGHDQQAPVFVLDGGYQAVEILDPERFMSITKTNAPNTHDTPLASPENYQTSYQPALLADRQTVYDTVMANTKDKSGQNLTQPHFSQIVDARSAGRFSGELPEPRAGLRSGHMPGAKNLPFNLLFTETGHWKSPDEIRTLMAAHDIDPLAKTIATCGSGVTACTLALTFYLIGNTDVGVYDGSWSEWAADDSNPIDRQ